MSNKFKDEMEKYYNKLSKADDILDVSNDRLNKLDDKIIKIKKILNDKTIRLYLIMKEINCKLKLKILIEN